MVSATYSWRIKGLRKTSRPLDHAAQATATTNSFYFTGQHFLQPTGRFGVGPIYTRAANWKSYGCTIKFKCGSRVWSDCGATLACVRSVYNNEDTHQAPRRCLLLLQTLFPSHTASLLGRARNAIICQLSRPLSMYKHRADLQKMTYAMCANLILGGLSLRTQLRLQK